MLHSVWAIQEKTKKEKKQRKTKYKRQDKTRDGRTNNPGSDLYSCLVSGPNSLTADGVWVSETYPVEPLQPDLHGT